MWQIGLIHLCNMQIELSPDVGAKREIYDEQKTNRAAKEENQTDVREK